MRQVNIHYAKTHLSRLVEDAAAGEELIIAKAGKPVARLVPLEAEKTEAASNSRNSFGILKGKITMHEDFDDPLPPEIAKAFGVKS